ncbi:MAG: hypothetical protein EPN22_16905 [Nitrospirae bacterium]|nr:MAG: hypothetical protein EPN22_16905 [Nitrospirota bacterium]
MSEQLQIGFELTARERLILSLIPTGKKNARLVGTIAEQSLLHWREVQQVVETLIHKHDYCIGSSSGKPCGYYIITDEQELETVYQSLRRRGIKILQRASKLKRIAIEDVFQQGRLEVM